MIAEATIEPLDDGLAGRRRRSTTRRPRTPSARPWSSSSTAASARRWAWTAPSRCSCVRDGLSFLDVIARQVLHAAAGVRRPRCPLIFMNSFRTRDDTLAALRGYDDLAVDGLPLEFLQNQEPKLLRRRPDAGRRGRGTRRSSGARPATATSTPRCSGTGLLDRLLDAGLPLRVRLQLRQPRRGARCPGGRLVRASRCAVRDRGGAPYPGRPQGRPLRPAQGRRPHRAARDRADRRARTRRRSPTSSRHRYSPPTTCGSTSTRCATSSTRRDGVLGLPLIRNEKTRRPRRLLDARR